MEADILALLNLIGDMENKYNVYIAVDFWPVDTTDIEVLDELKAAYELYG